MDEKFIEKINKVNAAWRPALEIVVVVSAILFYIVFPVCFVVASYFGHNISFPDEVKDGINSILITGGILAGLRTIEKTKNVTLNH